VRVSGRGRASGIETASEFFHARTLLDGKPYRCFVRSTEARSPQGRTAGRLGRECESRPRSLDLRGLGTRDFGTAKWADPEIEFVQVAGFDAGTWKGLAGMGEANREWLSTWEEFRVCADEFREIDAERVLVIFHRTGRGKTSGLEVGQIEAQGANLFHLGGGQVTRPVMYFDRDRAHADLGLALEAGSQG
jgi:hypothetical protein